MLIMHFQIHLKQIKSDTLLQHSLSDTLRMFKINEYLWICQTMSLLISNFKTIGYILCWKMCLYGIIMLLYKYNGSLLQKCLDIMYAIFTCQLHSYHIQNYFYKCPCCTHFYDFEMCIPLVTTCYNDDIKIVDDSSMFRVKCDAFAISLVVQI